MRLAGKRTGTTTIMEAAGDAKMRRVVRSVGTQLTDRQRVKDRGEIEREERERNGRKFSYAF